MPPKPHPKPHPLPSLLSDRSTYDVIVVGGGHAGCEAATAAARMGARTALVTHRADTIGELSCNPAIGGLGKGHLVREIDALDGLMGRVADASGIQFRILNRSKGPAVQGPRAQVDRKLYRMAMQSAIADTAGLDVVEGGVEDLLVDGILGSGASRIAGIVTSRGREIRAAAVVLPQWADPSRARNRSRWPPWRSTRPPNIRTAARAEPSAWPSQNRHAAAPR